MEKLKKSEAFQRALSVFGDWRTWGRSQHVAYGLIRGVPYVAMEKYANDRPEHTSIASALARLGAWPEPWEAEDNRAWWARIFGPKPAETPPQIPDPRKLAFKQAHDNVREVEALVVWVQKPVRVKRERPVRSALQAASG